MMNRVEMNDEMMTMVNGAAYYNDFTGKYEEYYHKGCGGEIWHVGELKYDCECSKCHEKHYFLLMFSYYTKAV